MFVLVAKQCVKHIEYILDLVLCCIVLLFTSYTKIQLRLF
jgi:hypothetical protein